MPYPYPNTKSHCLVCGSSDLSQIASLSGIPSSAQYFVSEPPTLDKTKDSITSLSAFQCNHCTHVQAFSPLVPYYKNVITASSLSALITKARDQKLFSFCQYLSNPSPSIVEIGMYRGQYLKHLLNIGYQSVYGIENCPRAVDFAKQAGVNSQIGYLLDNEFQNLSGHFYDIVLCFNFLEHVPDPFRFLLEIKNHIASPKSIFYFTMPSFHYIQSQMLLQEFVPDHVSYFTPKSLRTLFYRSGLEILSLDSINNDNDLEITAVLEKPSISPISTLFLDSLVSRINALIFEHVNSHRKVAFWGAGHRSLTLISQLNFSDISFIVDSAVFKQGTFCPDTSLPIVSPSYLAEQNVDLLFLSLPGIYASEVIESLKNKGVLPSSIYLIEGNDLSPLYIESNL